MAQANGLVEALVGTVIQTVGGTRAVVAEVAETGLALRVRGLDRPLLLPLREVRAGVRLWVLQGDVPSEEELVGRGIPPTRAVYLAPLLLACRRIPGFGKLERGRW
jgi:hypothetical protein